MPTAFNFVDLYCSFLQQDQISKDVKIPNIALSQKIAQNILVFNNKKLGIQKF